VVGCNCGFKTEVFSKAVVFFFEVSEKEVWSYFLKTVKGEKLKYCLATEILWYCYTFVFEKMRFQTEPKASDHHHAEKATVD
jgi:hypothetical protein